MADLSYQVPAAPEFSKAQIWAYWKSDPRTHAAFGVCPTCNKRQPVSLYCHEFGLPPECHTCATPVSTLDLVKL